MEQLSKFSRVVWMAIFGLILLKIGVIFWNPAGTFGGILPFCMGFTIFVLLGGWFVVLYRNSKRRSPLHQPALIGIIAAGFMSIVLIAQIVNTLYWNPTVYSINQIGNFIAYVLLIVAFVLLGRRVPAGKYRKAAYIAAFVPLIIAILSLTLLGVVHSKAWLSVMSDGEIDWNLYHEIMRRYHICSAPIFCILSYGPYAFFAYTMDSKK